MMLETERLILREMTDDDFDAIYAVLADSDITQHYPYTFDEARVRGWIARNKERYRTDGFGLWAVVLKETGEVIGDCGLTLQPINGQMLPEIGYHIHKACWRRGYASEAARKCMEYAFETLHFPAVYSYMTSDNAASYGVALKNGMKLVEEYDDHGVPHRVYALTREEWEQTT